MDLIILIGFVVAYFFVLHFIAKFAENKGRSYWGFWLLSALFLPFGLIAALLVAPLKADDKDMKCCPFCAEKIKSQAVVCRFCGREIDKVSNPVN